MLRHVISALALIPLAAAADAQGISLGEFEFQNSCAACHGAKALGHGPLENMLTTKPADLTMLQKENGGVFPVARIYAAIEGTADVQAHGARDMPVWGARYSAMLADDPAFVYSEAQRETFARTRILALIEYLSTLQKE